jgi:methyl-accepting chemotaxis protein
MSRNNPDSAEKKSLLRFKTKPKILSVALVPLVLFLAVGVLTIVDLKKMAETSRLVERTQLVLTETQHVVSLALEMEAGLRGYLLTGKDDYLEPYEHGKASIYQDFVKLHEHSSESPELVGFLNKAESSLNDWQIKMAERAIALRRNTGVSETMNDMADFVSEGHGKEYFDNFHAAMVNFQRAEQSLMAVRQANNHEISATTRTTIPIAIAVSIFVGAVFALLVGSNMAKAIGSVTQSMGRLAEGDNTVEISGQSRGDEVGDMAQSLEVFRDQLVKMQELEKQKAEGRDAEQNAVVKSLSSHLSQLSKGDLNVQITRSFPAEYEELRRDFNSTIKTLSDTVNQVAQTAGSIRNGADEVSQASDDLSRRTESQAATLEETAAALDELTASVKSSAEGARSVEKTMAAAREEAENSGEVVQSAVAAMTEIEQSSNQISQIISVIDDIAFQTNLLALNAGVEAARAGDAGRGFAVVASEVRALAQRSSDAATEIKTLIGDSSKQVEHGVDLVGKAGTALQSIVGQVNHISQQVSGIAEGASEQSIGLNEINTGMAQLDQVTQQNAAMVEEATAAGHLLKSDSAQLSDLMSHFQLPTGGSSTLSTEISGSIDSANLKRQHSAPLKSTGTDGQVVWQEF